jgi:alkylhydroperoxidase/carboxymuconolactone decarboxylase family protein YurZ
MPPYSESMDPRTRRFVTLAVLISLSVVVIVAALRG